MRNRLRKLRFSYIHIPPHGKQVVYLCSPPLPVLVYTSEVDQESVMAHKGKPTIVIVPGAMHSTKHYEPLMQQLRSYGYKCVGVPLKTTQSTDTPANGLGDDTNAIQTAVSELLDGEENDVVVLAHSYGGVPANNALHGLDTESRQAQGKSDSVKALAFMASLPIPKGLSPGGFLYARKTDGPKEDLSAVDMDSTGTFATPKSSDPGAGEVLFHDLPTEEAKKWAGMLRPMSMKPMFEETSYAAYQDIPTGYLYCSNDKSLPLVAQQYIMSAAKEAGAKIVLEETVEASHSPFLSKIEETSAFVRKLIELTGPTQ